MPDNQPQFDAEKLPDSSQGQDTEASEPVPGLLAPADVFPVEPAELLPSHISTIRALVMKDAQREQAAWREEVIRVWEAKLFDRGYQRLLWSRGQGWQLPAIGTGYHPRDAGSRSCYQANIYNSYQRMLTSALSREFPSVRFEPDDDESDADITASEIAEKIKHAIERRIGGKSFIQRIARLFSTDGRVLTYTRFVRDAQRFGFEPKPKGVVPEDEESQPVAGSAENQEASEEEPSNGGQEMASMEAQKPAGQEVTDIYDALETKMPMKANCLAECDYVQISREHHISIARAEHPDKASEIRPNMAGPGGDPIARIARVNVELGMENNFVTSDTTAIDVTEQVTWWRPGRFYDPDIDEKMRGELLELFPDGCMVEFEGETFIDAYNLSMDDYLELAHAQNGDGMHRAALCSWLIPIQKVLNNWLDLANDYLVRGVPQKWMDAVMFNAEALKNQSNVAGQIHTFNAPETPGTQVVGQYYFEEPALEFPQQLVPLIQMFKDDLPQLLTGAFPALFGGDTGQNDTASGIAVQRDQALGLLSIPWNNIKKMMATIMRQGVQSLAQSTDGQIRFGGAESLLVEAQTLKGNILCFPETDENFPESWFQKQARIGLLITEAMQNPTLAAIADAPDNLELIKNAQGLEDLVIPKLQSRDKQLGEIDILLQTSPQPNPQFLQVQKLLQAAQIAAQTNPQIAQGAQQAAQELQAIPQLISSVEIDPDFDDHATELATCVSWMMSPKGRSYKNGTAEEKAGYENVRLHALEHKQEAAKIQQQQQLPGKPPNITMNAKDLPPVEAAEAAQKAGLKSANPQDFVGESILQATEKHPGAIQ